MAWYNGNDAKIIKGSPTLRKYYGLDKEGNLTKNTDRFIILNSIITPDGTRLISHHTHDYVEYKDSVDGKTYMVDGGRDYLRRREGDYTEASVWSDDDFEKIRESLYWGTYGKCGTKPLEYVLLKDMTTEHIKAIVDTQPENRYTRFFYEELGYRSFIKEI